MTRHAGSVLRRVGLALATLACLACGGPEDEQDPFEFRATVATQAVKQAPLERLLTTTGTVRARREAKLVAQSSGRLQVTDNPETRQRWAVGDPIREGALVAVVAGEEMRTAARVAARRQALDEAESEARRIEQLHSEGVISAERLDQARTKRETARAELDAAFVQEAKARLTSPLDGFVSKITTAADGENVSAAAVIAEVVAFDDVLVDLDLSAGEVALVEPGQSVRIEDYASGATLPGAVARVAPAMDAQTRTFRVEVEAANAEHVLRPGMFVRASVVVEARESATVVPTGSVVNRDGQWIVFVVEAQRAQAREVELGLITPELTEVVRGVGAGDQVVTSGQDTLQDGARVIVKS